MFLFYHIFLFPSGPLRGVPGLDRPAANLLPHGTAPAPRLAPSGIHIIIFNHGIHWGCDVILVFFQP